jgi:membrane-bound metal-dependent hydrolase YbcI (DUF457 family)
MKDNSMFSVGHLALGYLSGRTSSKLLNVQVNIPILFLVSVLPDIDLLIPGLEHRGPTHSLIVFFLLFLPAIKTYGKGAIPYLIALVQHSLVGDYLTGGVQTFWPITTNWYGTGISISSLTNISLEWIIFLASLTLMFKTKDAWMILKPHPTNLLLFIPTITAFLPTFLSFPLAVPMALIIPHLIYITIFTLSILIDIKPCLEASKNIKHPNGG